MTKLQSLKQRLTRIIIIAVIGVVLMGAAYYVSGNFATTEDVIFRQAESDVNVFRARIAQLEQKFNIYETSFNAYRKLSKEIKQGRYTLNISKAKKTLDALRKRHRISNLNVQISSENDYGTPNPSAILGFTPVFREVKLSFAALSDVHIYAFLDSVKASFSGYLRFSKTTITRMRPLSDDILREVSRGATPTLINADVTFLWIGIIPKKDLNAEVTINAAP